MSEERPESSDETDLRAAHRRHRPRRYPSLVARWLVGALRRPARAEAAPLPAVSAGQVGVCFAGHASVLLRYASLDIVCDPLLGRWVRGVKRAVDCGLSPAELGGVDLILISHAHRDHLHRPTLRKLPRSATVVVPPRTAHLVSDLEFARVVELGVGQSLQYRDVDIVSAAVRHGDADSTRALSYVIRGNGPSVYFCGDSGYFSGFAEIGRRFAPDIALLPIGGYAPSSFRARHMSPLDALTALEDLLARVLIPIHYGAFPLSYERLDEPARWLRQLVRERQLERFVVPLAPGSSRVFVPPRTRSIHRPLSTIESALEPKSSGVPETVEVNLEATAPVPEEAATVSPTDAMSADATQRRATSETESVETDPEVAPAAQDSPSGRVLH